jgi:tetratricopeptide (TPR) repeat protein
MKTIPLMYLGLSLALAVSRAPAQTEDPAKVAEYQKRFEQGYALEQAGQLAEARTVYDGILAEQPEAKRSLLEAGRISLRLNDLLKADGYLEKLHALVPDFTDATELLIQINQALGRDVKVERLVREFKTLHDNGTLPEFSNSLRFVREQIHLDQGDVIVITQYFDYTQSPRIAWMAQLLDASGKVKRQIVLIYDPEATKAIRAKDPKFASTEEFLLVEDVMQDGGIKKVDVYMQIFALPEYKKVRNTMLAVIANSLKPIYSQDVEGAPTQ